MIFRLKSTPPGSFERTGDHAAYFARHTKLPLWTTATVISGLLATDAWSADYETMRTLQLPLSTTEAWHVVGDFCDIDDWHPDIRACSLKVIEGRLHRVLTTTDGAESVERRIAVEPGLSYTYKLVSSSLPIENYTATFSIEPNDGSRISWSARFSSDDPAMEAAVAEMFETGLSAIKRATEKDE